MASAPVVEEEMDWENRRLCADGNCIGVIGPDGRCKECGKPADETLAEEPLHPTLPSTENESPEIGTEEIEAESVSDNDSTDSENFSEEKTDDDWENRRLCSDGNCIGIIGPDGCCKECGKPAENDQNA